MAVKLPYHAHYHLEAQAGLRLIDIEAVGKADALVGNFDVKMSVDFSGVDPDDATTFRVGVFDRVCDKLVDQKSQGNGVVRRKQHGVGMAMQSVSARGTFELLAELAQEVYELNGANVRTSP